MPEKYKQRESIDRDTIEADGGGKEDRDAKKKSERERGGD